MIQYLMILLIAATCAPVEDSTVGMSGPLPLVFPSSMPMAAQMISDILSDDDTWRAGIDAFLRNSSTNISFQDYVNGSNQTKLIA